MYTNTSSHNITEATLMRTSRSNAVSISALGIAAFVVGRTVGVCRSDSLTFEFASKVDIEGVPFGLHWSADSFFLTVSVPNCVKIFRLDRFSLQLSLAGSVSPFPSTISSKRISVLWHACENSVFAVFDSAQIKVFRSAYPETSASWTEIHCISYQGVQKCMWSATGDRLLAFRSGQAAIHAFDAVSASFKEAIEIQLPLRQPLRAIQSIPHQSDAMTDSFVAVFDMPEDSIFSEFDIMGLRGGQDPLSEMIVPSKSSNPAIIMPSASPAAEPPVSNSFNMNFSIPTASIIQKTASAMLITFCIKDNLIVEQSRVEIPILMPDMLLLNRDHLIISNNSVGAILVYGICCDTGIIDSKIQQVIRLEPKHFALGMGVSRGKQSNNFGTDRLIVLEATRTQKYTSTGVTGFRPSLEAEVDLRCMLYEQHQVAKLPVQQQATEKVAFNKGYTNEEDDSDDCISTFSMVLPGANGGLIGNGRSLVLDVSVDKLGHLDDSLDRKLDDMTKRLDRMEQKQDRILELLERFTRSK
ncbi:hypothetical protein BJ741DRAFT_651071 [Chytriomyces cf. hyalinus JEL632]|nr:hypothetical protein BJ741DRAFT_651071 [Chytriomyces cf. hyalinus JEL632]